MASDPELEIVLWGATGTFWRDKQDSCRFEHEATKETEREKRPHPNPLPRAGEGTNIETADER